jgi:hypothetical protein
VDDLLASIAPQTQLFPCGLVRQSPPATEAPAAACGACGIRSTHGVCEERIRHHRVRNKTGRQSSADCYPKEEGWPRNNASSPIVFTVSDWDAVRQKDGVMKSVLSMLDLIAAGDS